MSSRDSKPSPLVAFPSVSSSLSSLHQATSMQGVALHHNMYANRAKESEAKLKKALSNASQNIPAGSPYTTPVHIICRRLLLICPTLLICLLLLNRLLLLIDRQPSHPAFSPYLPISWAPAYSPSDIVFLVFPWAIVYNTTRYP
ncbi:hypothetical protein GGG16DRAFT_125694 [Schizophyllum commune]